MSTNYYDAENNKLIPIAGKGDFPADYGTKAEFETKKDSLPDGTVFTTTDEFVDAYTENYSTDEMVVGKWIDGKNIYRRVVKGLTWENGLWNKNVFTKIDVSEIDSFISVKGISSLGRALGLMEIDKTEGLLGSFSADTNGTIIVEYTKN